MEVEQHLLQYPHPSSPPLPRTSPHTPLVFAWGRGDFGQLGLDDDVGREHPTLVGCLLDKDIVHIAASDFHTAFLTVEGELYTTGSNDSGQLGAHLRETLLSPAQVAALDTHTISHVACGQGHTVAVTDSGALASWGAAEFGQLGQKEAASAIVMLPRIIRGTRELHFVQISCGATHTLALTGSGSVYSFGQGIFGALGHGNTESCSAPIVVQDLWGFGIVQVACGENHSGALSVDGQVFTWGRGKYGQLGHGMVQNENRPLQVKALADQMIVQVVCGGDHMMALNNDGELFAWGCGHWGQTGLGTVDDVLVPKQVQFPGKEYISQASAGARHSIALSTEGKVFGWGDGEQGQLGKTESQVLLVPYALAELAKDNLKILYIVAGGEHSFAVYQQSTERPQDSLGGKLETISTTLMLNEECQTSHEEEKGKASQPAELNLQPPLPWEKSSIQQTFQAQDPSFLESFLLRGPNEIVHGSGLKPFKMPALLRMLEEGAESSKKVVQLGHAVDDVFSSVRFITLSFKPLPSFWEMEGDNMPNARKIHAGLEGPGLDAEMIRDMYQHILELYNPEILKRLGNAMIRLFEGIERHMDSVPDSRWTRALLIGLQCPLIGEKGLGDLVSTRLFSIFARVSPSVRTKLVQWLRTYPRDIFGGRFARGVLKCISNRKDMLSVRGGISENVAISIKALALLYEANNMENLIHYTEFYSHSISDHANMLEEYIKWAQHHFDKSLDPLISFCQVPFVLTPQAKSTILQVEADLQKRRMVEQSVVEHFLGNSYASPFLILEVQRSNLVKDSLQQLMMSNRIDLKKPLKVIFKGEAGVDEGGVTKEFFQLLTRDLFNVDYGMFTYDEDTRNFWFNSNSMESELEFQLVGIILGLAIYNGVILDVHLPLVVYKKLLGLKPHVEDLKDVQPQIAKSLLHLLEFDGDVAAFSLVFQVSYDYFGELKTYDLTPNGGNAAVTNENRGRYIDLYVNYLLEDSIKAQFSAFKNGFDLVCGGPALSLFHYEELELLICGLPHFDFDALERVTIYQGGYTNSSPVIKWFWELVKEMTWEEKKALLFFSTGNDRAPVGGLGSLRFIIQRNGDDTDRLPTAHTCFNILMLPEYSSKPKLENRLKLAISNSTGFGLQ